MMGNRYWNPRNQVILIICLLGFSLVWVWYFSQYKTKSEEITLLSARHVQLKQANRSARTAVGDSGIAKIQSAISAYDHQETAIRHLLPFDTAAAPLLKLTAETARAFNVTVLALQPGVRTQAEKYSIDHYDLIMRGHYHDVAAFVAEIGSFDQIVHVTSFDAKVLPPSEATGRDRLVQAHAILEAYIRVAGAAGDSASVGEAGPGAKKDKTGYTVQYDRDEKGRIWELIHVPGKELPLRIPVPRAQRQHALDELSKQTS
jgi:type IV pilus assembly protein PilO